MSTEDKVTPMSTEDKVTPMSTEGKVTPMSTEDKVMPMSTEDKMDELRMAMPTKSSEELRKLLAQAKGDMEQAIRLAGGPHPGSSALGRQPAVPYPQTTRSKPLIVD